MYRLDIREHAEKQMRRLPRNVYDLLLPRILSLGETPRPHGVKKLMGGMGWRIRVGNYRVIYEINDQERIVTIASVASRQSAYE
jgi:mRNA interferase RelE/StbE